MTSGDEIEAAKRPTSAPAEEPTLDDLLRMIQETHAETAGNNAKLDDLLAKQHDLNQNVQAFVNIMTDVNQRQNRIEDRLKKVEDWQGRHGGVTIVPDGTDG